MAGVGRVVVVGASLAGVRTAQGLRDRGFDGEVVLVGAEEGLPYDRPPLSKGLLAGQTSLGDIQLLSGAEMAGLGLELRLGRRARAVDAARRVLQLEGGESVQYDTLVVATGSAPWMPHGWEMLEGVHLLRTVDDCVELRADFERSPRVAVVGAGFIGCEVAATARGLGLDVTLIEPLPAPLARALGPEMARVCADIHIDAGVRLLCGTAVEGFDGAERVERVRLSDGRKIDADVVVVGIGVRPVTDWLVGSGVAVADGVLCDARCATSVPGVFAAGDVARWFNPLFERAMRIEHWTNASAQGTFVARAILDGPQSGDYSPVPFVWSEQHGIKIEIVGLPQPDDRVRLVEGTLAERRFVALYERDEKLTGAVALNASRSLLKYRRLLAAGGSRADASGSATSPSQMRVLGAATEGS